jgi:hypothetical protein
MNTNAITINDQSESEYVKILGLLDQGEEQYSKALKLLASLGHRRITPYGLKYSLNTAKHALVITANTGEGHTYPKWPDVPFSTVYDILWYLQPLSIDLINKPVIKVERILSEKLRESEDNCILRGCLTYYSPRGILSNAVVIAESTQATTPFAASGRDRVAALRQLAHILY